MITSGIDYTGKTNKGFRRKKEEKMNKAKSSGKSAKAQKKEGAKSKPGLTNNKPASAKSKLIKMNEEYLQLFDHAPVGYFILFKNGIIINANQTGIGQLGSTKSKLIGKHLSAFLNSETHQHDFNRHIRLLIETKKKQQVECKIRRADGSEFFALIESVFLQDKNNMFKYLLSTIIDISKQKEQELRLESALVKEKELNEMKSNFITIASHEFRTPLAAILTSTELIEKYNKPGDEEKKAKHFRRIKTSISRLKEILIDFISADEIEKGKIKNNPETFDLSEFTEHLIREVKTFNGIHNLKYEHKGPFTTIFLDKKLLEACMTNLVINAYKYSPDGGVVEITSEQKEPGSVRITVKDEGIGIPQKDQVHIFEKFYRGRNAEAMQGTGLGLNITKKLATIMGGDISFESKENEGSTFTLKFKSSKKSFVSK